LASRKGLVGRKIHVNDYPMNIVGVSAADFRGFDPTQSPQIRVPVLMKRVMLPEWTWMRAHDRRALGASLRAPQAGIHRRRRAAATAVHPDPAVRNHVARGEGLVGVFARSVHEREDARHERRDRVLATAERFLDRAHRPDVHGRSRLADCMARTLRTC